MPELLSMRGIDKRFPGVHALKDVDLSLGEGEVLALLGENGAGKSTLIKVLGGAHTPDAGTVTISGTETVIASPSDAEEAGVAVIYQEFNLVPTLSATDNIFLGCERTGGFGFIKRGEQEAEARALFDKIGIDVDPSIPCGQLTVAQQQGVEIAKALSKDARILVMDEPSATLTLQEVERLFDIIRELTGNGIGVIYISHRLEEIFDIADRVTVLRDGELVDTEPVSEVNRESLIEMMVGRKLENEFPHREPEIRNVRLSVKGLKRAPKVDDVSFDIRAGEVLGLTGLVGAGRTETARLIFGADAREAGEIVLDGKSVAIFSPRDAIRSGICLLTEDRKSQGLVLGRSVRENFGLPNLASFTGRGAMLDRRKESEAFAEFVESLRIKIPHQEQVARNLSGGNQQKVVLAKWLFRNAEVIIFDEPTRGIDVGAKFEIYTLINDLAAKGKAILMISSELPEVLGMSDRILVMHEGRITGEIENARTATQEDIMRLAVA